MELKGTTAGRSPEAVSRQTYGKPWDPQLLAARDARIALYAVRAARRRDLWTGSPVLPDPVPDAPSDLERARRAGKRAVRSRLLALRRRAREAQGATMTPQDLSKGMDPPPRALAVSRSASEVPTS